MDGQYSRSVLSSSVICVGSVGGQEVNAVF